MKQLDIGGKIMTEFQLILMNLLLMREVYVIPIHKCGLTQDVYQQPISLLSILNEMNEKWMHKLFLKKIYFVTTLVSEKIIQLFMLRHKSQGWWKYQLIRANFDVSFS